LKFYEAAKFYYYPGMHEPGGFVSMGLNKAWWSKLSKSEQLLIESLAIHEAENMMSEANALNAQYLQRLVKEHGVQLREFSDEIYESFGKAAEEVYAETRAHSDLAKRVYESFAAARKNVAGWMKLADVGYSVKRNRAIGL
ncbi:MAG: hypothetical protein R3357_07040, partial [Burkholderiales bacterium]|nr:hypothetical protein [Burkholderiales bacterium]